MSTLRILPMAPTKPQKGRDFLPRNIINKGTNRPRLLEPVTLPDLACPNALVVCYLEIDSPGHWPPVDRTVDSTAVLEPYLVSPFLGFAVARAYGVVVD